MTKNSLTLAVAFAALASLSAKAQIIAYDNSSNYEDRVTGRGNVELGDEINLSTGATTLTDFQFEYNYTGPIVGNPDATGVLRFYAKDGSGGTPGTLLFESSSFTLQAGFHQGAVHGLSLNVPGTFIWTVAFNGIAGTGDNAGLLFYDPPTTGSSFDDHWEFVGEPGNLTPHWVLTDNQEIINGAELVDNFGALVTTVPEPTTVGLLIGGAALLGIAARRRQS